MQLERGGGLSAEAAARAKSLRQACDWRVFVEHNESRYAQSGWSKVWKRGMEVLRGGRAGSGCVV